MLSTLPAPWALPCMYSLIPRPRLVTAHCVHTLQELAYKLVAKMGWAEGQGLGKDNHGISKHLWTKKRTDVVGLGAEASNDWGAHSVQTNTYNSLLAKLDVIVNNSDDSDSSSSSDEDADEKKVRSAAAAEIMCVGVRVGWCVGSCSPACARHVPSVPLDSL